jgi:hypothetical protein
MIIPIVPMMLVIFSSSNVPNARKLIMAAVRKNAGISVLFQRKREGYNGGSGCLMGVNIPRRNLDY